ncbi:MAG TPA: DUF4136 domain-containing protein [Candidatus Sulfomarinibacteraceae bacterium]|nr:DUF4136 domain-containing protein [Candidatus Sulfomarinibacteraceae bacterium]
MHKLVGIAIVLALVAAPAAAQKVYVDYDRSADISSYETFAWGDTPEASLSDNNPFIHSRIKNAIEYHLTKAGLTEVGSNPDLYVTYYGESGEEVSFMTTSVGWGYGYGPGWYWDPYWGGMGGMTTTTPIVHEAGTLVIDIWDAKTKNLVWRGTLSGTIPDDPQKMSKKVEAGIEKIVTKWQKMYAKDQKSK